MSTLWKNILGYKGLYQINPSGQVRRIAAARGTYPGKILTPGINTSGYPMVVLRKNGKSRTWMVHTLVAQAWLGKPLEEINHKDGNKKNYHVSNLEWVTKSQNSKHAFESGLLNPRKGEQHHRAVLKASDITQIRAMRASGMGVVQLGRQFGVSYQAIQKILKGKLWKHI